MAMGLLIQNPVDAGVLKAEHQRPKAGDFFDWKYAQKVWFDMNTLEAEEREWDKYKSDFKPWLDLYKSDQRRAFEELKKYPKDKRANIMRGYDIQLAYDTWRDQVYLPWLRGFHFDELQRAVNGKSAKTFDEVLAAYGQRATCVPKQILDECGPVPDWRDAEDIQKEQEMMAKARAEADEASAERARKGRFQKK